MIQKVDDIEKIDDIKILKDLDGGLDKMNKHVDDVVKEMNKKYGSKLKKPIDKKFYGKCLFLSLPFEMNGYYRKERAKFLLELMKEYGVTEDMEI